METTILFVVATLSFLICGMIASGKNRSFIGWGLLGFLTPLIGLIVACSLKDRALPSLASENPRPREWG